MQKKAATMKDGCMDNFMGMIALDGECISHQKTVIKSFTCASYLVMGVS